MAIVRAFQIEGLKLWFWSADHEPPHFHAKKTGEWEVKVGFLFPVEQMIETKWAQKRPSARVLRQLCQLAETARVELLLQWEEGVGTK